MNKERNYSDEHNRRKRSKKRIGAYVDKEIAAQLEKKLKTNGKTFSEWLKENINEYLKGDKL